MDIVKYKRGRSSSKPFGKSGSALLTVLGLVVLLTLIIVAFTLAMRMERQMAHYYVARTSAELMAREGISYIGTATLTGATSSNYWVSQPGRITIWKANSQSIANIDLFSGTTGGGVTGFIQAPDINKRVLTDNSDRVITGSGDANDPEMRVNWIYVRQSGARETNQSPSASSSDPIVGRFAYWADIENARVDLNTAWSRSGNSNSVSHTSMVDLGEILGTSNATLIRDHATNTPFNSADEPRRLGPDISALISSNAFFLSHYARSPDLNPWGESKIVLTTQSKLSDGGPFIDILNSVDIDPGSLKNLSYSKVQNVFSNLVNILERSDWPYADGSFANKYGTNGARQLALDIIEYVRAIESTNRVVEGMRFNPYASTGIPGTTPQTLVGTTRRPMITEMGIWLGHLQTNATNPAATYFPAVMKVEIYLPRNYGASSLDLGQAVSRLSWSWTGFPGINSVFWRIQSTNTTPSQIISTGQYAVTTLSTNIANTTNNGPRPSTVYLRASLSPNGGVTSGGWDIPAWDVANISDSGTNMLSPYILDSQGTVLAHMSTMQVSDPRVNKYAPNWAQKPNTLGSQNSNWEVAVDSFPPQDSTADRERLLHIPPPKGESGNPYGIVRSVAEIGYITTGIQSGVPWRSARLQPTSGSSTNIVPDWALLDILRAPLFSTNSRNLYVPTVGELAGKVNINSAIKPFSQLLRTNPLASVFSAVTNSSGSQIGIENIISHNLAINGVHYGHPDDEGYFNYTSIGEIAEILGIADNGEEGENVLRQFVDLTTVQSDSYRAFSVGQAVKQTPDGRFIVESECRIESVIEIDRTKVPAVYKNVLWKQIPL